MPNGKYSQLAADLKKVVAWQDQFLPERGDFARCFEFATLCDTVTELANILKKPAMVRLGIKQCFAGSPGTKGNYNWVEVGPYEIHFGVRFPMASGAHHAPDIALVHSQQPSPLIIIECKHYGGGALPIGLIKEFCFVLLELRWVVFGQCMKLSQPGSWQKGTYTGATGVNRDALVCSHFNMCKSKIVSNCPSTAEGKILLRAYDCEIMQGPTWR